MDLNRADPELPPDALALLGGGPSLLERARRVVAGIATDPNATAVRPLADVKLLAPIPRPPTIICVGLNYADHAAEAGLTIPARPSVFLKAHRRWSDRASRSCARRPRSSSTTRSSWPW